MKNLFDPQEAKEFAARYAAVPPALALKAYTSRLIGKDPLLVLHGGGNTSIKIRRKDIFGEDREVLFVKASGADLATIEPSNLVGLELRPLQKLSILETLADEELENQLQIRKVRFDSPDPSVEALLHAFLPFPSIDHSHADAILALTNLREGETLLQEALGRGVIVLPYIKPGFDLAKAVSEVWRKDPAAEAVVVRQHGIFTRGDDARASYERMIAYVERAEKFLEEKTSGRNRGMGRSEFISPREDPAAVARLLQAARGACAFRAADGRLRRFYAEVRSTPDLVRASLLPESGDLAASGVLTPDHVTRTKNLWAFIEKIPEDDAELQKTVGGTVAAYRAAYERYFHEQAPNRKDGPVSFDPYPRVFWVGGVGIAALGFTRQAARIAADIAEHTVKTKLLARRAGAYVPLEAAHIFEMEYWPLQRKKLGREVPPPLQGQVAVVTGAAGAIGLGIADRLLAAGAVVALADVDETHLAKVHSILAQRYGEERVEKILMDVTDEGAVGRAFQEISLRLGGIDIVVPNAGIAHVARIEELDARKFDRVIAVNLQGTFHTIKAAIPIFRRQGTGGNIVVVSSKNVFDPGASFGAYSASKAGAHQIAKIAALELAEMGVRVNLVNPDAVFGDDEVPSKLWELVGPERMKSRGLDPAGLRDYYRQRNLLKVSVTAEHVGNAVVFFASEATPTTGATLPVDGGIPAAFPR